MHWETDFSAPTGTPIYATGDGKVSTYKRSRSGYGRHIVIDHGFGYQTLYAHMSKIEVRRGQRVKRDLIGYVGSTGSSTAPHLHYEVIKDGRKINPINYFKHLSGEQYEEMLKISSLEPEFRLIVNKFIPSCMNQLPDKLYYTIGEVANTLV